MLFREDELVAVLPSKSRILGLTIDIGSTKIAAYLVDLEISAVLSKRNHQSADQLRKMLLPDSYADSHPHGRNFTRKAHNGIKDNDSRAMYRRLEKTPNKLSKLSQCVIRQSITFF